MWVGRHGSPCSVSGGEVVCGRYAFDGMGWDGNVGERGGKEVMEWRPVELWAGDGIARGRELCRVD